VALAALSESLDYVADRIQQQLSGGAAAAASRQQQQQQHIPGGDGARAGSPTGGRRGGRGSGGGVTLVDTLAVTVDRYRSLAGACARAIRLDLLLLAAHHMGSLAAASHVAEPDDVRQVRSREVGCLSTVPLVAH
jgi:hypothetical protein